MKQKLQTFQFLVVLCFVQYYSSYRFFRSFQSVHNRDNFRVEALAPMSPPQSSYSRNYKGAETTTLFNEYDGAKIDSYFYRRPFEVWERLVDIGSPILGWWLTTRFDNLTNSFRSPEERQLITRQRAIDLKDAIVQGKSITFIKSGQALALRPDLLKSMEYVEELSKLQNEVGTFDHEDAMKIICEELNLSSANDAFEFDPTYPIASASIGQVYRARLRRSPETLVAVKVQRPDALLTVDLDLFILRRIAEATKSTKKLRSDLLGIVDEFGRQLYQELNYQQEARNCERFKAYYGSIPNIYVPRVYHNYTRRRVLTLEFIEGVKGPWKEDGEKMLTIGLQCSVLQLLGKGYLHVDPHNGNLLKTKNQELAYLDFGMMTDIPAAKRYALIGTVLGLVNKDLDLVLRSLQELEFFAEGTNITESIEALNTAIFNATDSIPLSPMRTTSRSRQAMTLNFTRLNENILQIQQKLPVQIPPYYLQIIRSLTILEGLALSVDNNFRLIQGAYPFIIRQIVKEPSPELNELLRTVLINPKTNRIRWNRLESWIKVSYRAEEAMKGNFQALKSAQEETRFAPNLQTYLGEMTTEVGETGDGKDSSKEQGLGLSSDQKNDSNRLEGIQLLSLLLDYLLSENGQYLREPLIDEILDLLQNLEGTGQNLLSFLSNRLIPPANPPPNRQTVLQFFRGAQSLFLSSLRKNPEEAGDSATVSNLSLLKTLSWISSWVIEILQDPEQYQRDYEPLLLKLNKLFLQVLGKSIEQRGQETMKAFLSPNRIQSLFLSPLSQLLDWIPIK